EFRRPREGEALVNRRLDGGEIGHEGFTQERVEPRGVAGLHRGQAGGRGEVFLGLRDVEQGAVVEPRTRVLEHGRRLEEGLQVRLPQSTQVKIRWPPDGDGQGVVRIVEEVLDDRDVLRLVIPDLVDQHRAQSGQPPRPRPSPSLPGSHQGHRRHGQGRKARRTGQDGTPCRCGLIARGRVQSAGLVGHRPVPSWGCLTATAQDGGARRSRSTGGSTISAVTRRAIERPFGTASGYCLVRSSRLPSLFRRARSMSATEGDEPSRRAAPDEALTSGLAERTDVAAMRSRCHFMPRGVLDRPKTIGYRDLTVFWPKGRGTWTWSEGGEAPRPVVGTTRVRGTVGTGRASSGGCGGCWGGARGRRPRRAARQ